MTRTRLLNVAGIAVALVLIASWALGVLWSEHHAPAAAARTAATTSVPVTATGTPDAARVHPLRPKARRTASATASSSATASAAATAAATHHATTQHPAGSHHTSGGGQSSSTPSAHPTSSGGSSTPTPSPTPTQDVLTQILGGLTHLPH